jgi:DNA-binding response OmpR family regulator
VAVESRRPMINSHGTPGDRPASRSADDRARLRILVVEDEEKVAKALQEGLEGEGYDAVIARTGEDAFFLVSTETFDVVLLDLGLPGRDGFQILAALRQQGRDTRVLVLTARDTLEDRVKGLDGGADDYLVKPFAMEELVARVDALLRRGRAITDTQRLQVGDLTLDLLRREAQRDGRIIELTAKEFALLEYLMRHPGQVLTRTQIIDHVWRYDSDALSNVVDIYIHYLRDKIDRGSARPMIKTMRGVGYRIEP